MDTYVYTESDLICLPLPWIDGEAPQLSKFDLELHKRWDKAMAAGVFRYGIDHIITRAIPGSKHYLAQLNTLRATEKRKPQDIFHLHHPFNEKLFNFTWVKAEEIIFNLHKLAPNTEGTSLIGNTENMATRNGDLYHGEVVVGPVNDCDSLVKGSLGDLTSASCVHSESAINHEKFASERHVVIVNVSPVEYGHCLLVPEIDSHKPQVLTETSLKVAIETLLLSNHRGMRMGFNSLCGLASVNHLHFHLYYLDHELMVEHAPVSHLAGRYFEFTGHPCPGFALQLHGSTVNEMARLTYQISSYFHDHDIAHNVFMTRGSVFGEGRNSMLTTIRLFIWPRKKFIASESSSENTPSEEFNVACIELAGHLAVKEEEGYHHLTEARADAVIAHASLPQEQHVSIRDAVTRMGLEDSVKLHTHL